MTNTVRSNDSTAIAYDRSGDGPPLILVAGAMSQKVDAVELASHLASTFSVFAYDRRGRGDSGDTQPYAVEREIEDLGAVIAAGGSAFVFGHSSGAVLGLRAAGRRARHPEARDVRAAIHRRRQPRAAARRLRRAPRRVDRRWQPGRRGRVFLTDSVGVPFGR
jgi:pimeloyl-ACP methyl ester carboxylesterase